MEAKRTAQRRRGSDKGRESELKFLRKLNRRAQAEVKRLLKRNQTGTITRLQLQAGLKELGENLELLGFHYFRL